MSLTILSSKMQPLIQRTLKSQGTRAMAILSKESGEEYKKLVGLLLIQVGIAIVSIPFSLMTNPFLSFPSRTTLHE
jgi:hypothetical protein